MRALTINLFGHNGDWPARREPLRAGLAELRPDVVTLLVRCGDHGPTLRVADCRLALHEPVGGVQPSDHYGVLADLVAATEPAGERGGAGGGGSTAAAGGRPVLMRPAGEPDRERGGGTVGR